MKRSRTVDWTLAAVVALALAASLLLLASFERHTVDAATARLTTMLELRASVLKGHLESLRSEVLLWSSRDVVVDIFVLLNRANEMQDQDTLESFGDTTTSALGLSGLPDVQVDERIRAFARHHDYYDVFLIGPNGDVLYTVAREADYGTNLLHGPYADTGLGRLFQSLLTSEDGTAAMTDFSPYPPSNNEPAAFLGAKVMAGEELVGVYAIQLPVQPIDHIMQFSAGMGETGETYLVGEDRLMRSTSRFFRDSTVLKTRVDGPTVAKALENRTGVEIVDDYRGIPVFSAYRPFEFEGIRWAMLGEQDVAEVRQPIVRARIWLAAGFALLCAIVVLMRFLLVRIVLPTSVATLLGLSFLSMENHTDD